MSSLELRESSSGSLLVALSGGAPLWTYCYEPTTPANEAPRPFAHPLYSIDGDILSNWRPNDHPWHHGLSFTLTSVDGVNFWGGPTHREQGGYQWRDDHGEQRHVGWEKQTADELVQQLEWRAPKRDNAVLIEERRVLTTTLLEDGWSLGWSSRVLNRTGKPLVCHNYHSMGGLVGSHYSGLQFRGARGLLDEHGDATIGLLGEQGGKTVEELHGVPARWLEWHAQHDSSLRRTRIRFTSPDEKIPWFVRKPDPLVAFPPHRESAWVLQAGETKELNHLLSFHRS